MHRARDKAIPLETFQSQCQHALGYAVNEPGYLAVTL